MALGGGCEILLHSSAIQAHAETYTGLVEVGVGVVPGWGGCKEMLLRWQNNPKAPKGPMPAVAKVFEYVSTANVAKSAQEAQEMLILRDGDGITMNRDRLLHDAKQRALAMVDGYQPPEEQELRLPGAGGRAALDLAVDGFHLQGMATDHDVVVSGEVANILTGGDADMTEVLSEDDLLKLERESFVRLLKTPGHARPHRTHADHRQAAAQLEGNPPPAPRHSREGGNPGRRHIWTPAFAGVADRERGTPLPPRHGQTACVTQAGAREMIGVRAGTHTAAETQTPNGSRLRAGMT